MKEIRDPETYAILGAAMDVHRELGHGFIEIVYHTAMALEVTVRGIAFQAEVPLPIRYKGKLLTCSYRADFICFERVLVETKAISQLTGPIGRRSSTHSKQPDSDAVSSSISERQASSMSAWPSIRTPLLI
jgi:GxxExxY protein